MSSLRQPTIEILLNGKTERRPRRKKNVLRQSTIDKLTNGTKSHPVKSTVLNSAEKGKHDVQIKIEQMKVKLLDQLTRDLKDTTSLKHAQVLIARYMSNGSFQIRVRQWYGRVKVNGLWTHVYTSTSRNLILRYQKSKKPKWVLSEIRNGQRKFDGFSKNSIHF